MIYDSVHLTRAKEHAADIGVVLSPNTPQCCKCKARKLTTGGKRYLDRYGRRKFICRDCVNAQAQAIADSH